MFLNPPAGDASFTPAIGFAGDPMIKYKLSSTGTWRVIVATADLISGGTYDIALACNADATPTLPQNCVTQPMSCGQAADWATTATSCRFSDNNVYAMYDLGIFHAGDAVTLTAHSDYYDPGVAIYGPTSGTALLYAWGSKGRSDAVVTYRATSDTPLRAAVYGPSNQPPGEFYLSEKCDITCGAPTFTSQPPATQKVQYNGRTTLSVRVGGTGPFAYRWFDVSDPLTGFGTGADFVTPLLTKTTTYEVDVTGSCGTIRATAMLAVDPPPRRRSVRH